MALGIKFKLSFVLFVLLINISRIYCFMLFLKKTTKDHIYSELDMNNKKKIHNAFYPIKNKTILHTSPHPDDVTLGYLPYINWLLNNYKNNHFFFTMTNGSNAVRGSYLSEVFDYIESDILNTSNLDNYKDIYLSDFNRHLESYILSRILKASSIIDSKSSLLLEIKRLKECLKQGTNSFKLNDLKGAIREFEEESVWKSFGIDKENIISFRAKFYFDNSKFDIDVTRLYKMLIKINPNIVTVAMDPKGIGPLTHYKTFLVVQSAVKRFYEKTKNDIEIIGYRNVWHQFEPIEANMFFPVTENDFDCLNNTFLTCYKSQVKAMFPNSKYKGNFAEISISIMKDNLRKIKAECKFNKTVKGFCFLKKMEIREFLDLHL